MANNEPRGISLLWKQEDWLAVWAGFLIIILVLAGLTIKLPKLKWTTDGEFAAYAATEASPVLEKIIAAADEKKEAALKESAGALRAALEAKDRKAIGEAAKKIEAVSREVKDEGLKKKSAKLAKGVGAEAGNLLSRVLTLENFRLAIVFGAAYLVLSIVAVALMGVKAADFAKGFPVVFLIALAGQFIAGNYTVLYYGLEYVIWCLALGLFVSNVIGVPAWLKAAARTEFFIKTGVVVLGSGIFFKEIVQAGIFGIVQALLVVSAVWYACWWLARKMGVDDEFAAILSSAVSICGVSAAIATSGAIKGDPKKLSYVTSLVLICAVPMLIIQPLIAKWAGMSDIVAGAWLGGTLDTSGSVVAAGALISEAAMKTGVIVKMSQNVLIGLVAFILSVVWTLKAFKAGEKREEVSAGEIWNRFPKFVLGFMVASVVFSFFLSPSTVDATKGMLGGLRTWWFALAFTCIGLETNFGDIAKLGGGRPAAAFLAAQAFNIVWTLLLAYLLFGGVVFPAPDIR